METKLIYLAGNDFEANVFLYSQPLLSRSPTFLNDNSSSVKIFESSRA